MELKWLEDLMALAEAGSFSKAAVMRNVTHPAFGRRIRALESWAGVELVRRGSAPITLTPAGVRFLNQAKETFDGLMNVRDEIQSTGNESNRRITVASGRTLAHTWVADWMASIPLALRPALFCIRTSGVAETLTWLEEGTADLLVAYHHPSIALRAQGRSFLQKTLAHDRLVPVTQRQVHRTSKSELSKSQPLPYLAYSPTLALAGLVSDHLNRSSEAPSLRRVVECDSVDALLEYVLKGMGVCWLPWSLVSQACSRGQLMQLWGKSMEIPFEVRLVRLRRRLTASAEALWTVTQEV